MQDRRRPVQLDRVPRLPARREDPPPIQALNRPPTAAPVPEPEQKPSQLAVLLSTRRRLRDAMIVREVLGPPLALRQDEPPASGT
jgi:hypothetical protein